MVWVDARNELHTYQNSAWVEPLGKMLGARWHTVYARKWPRAVLVSLLFLVFQTCVWRLAFCIATDTFVTGKAKQKLPCGFGFGARLLRACCFREFSELRSRVKTTP